MTMLDKITNSAIEGVTVIEEEIASVSVVLAKQIGSYLKESGKSVFYLQLESDDAASSIPIGLQGSESSKDLTEVKSGSMSTNFYDREERSLPFEFLLEGLNYDLIVIQQISSYLFDKSEKEAVDIIKDIRRLARLGRSFLITFEEPLLSKRVAGYLK